MRNNAPNIPGLTAVLALAFSAAALAADAPVPPPAPAPMAAAVPPPVAVPSAAAPGPMLIPVNNPAATPPPAGSAPVVPPAAAPMTPVAVPPMIPAAPTAPAAVDDCTLANANTPAASPLSHLGTAPKPVAPLDAGKLTEQRKAMQELADAAKGFAGEALEFRRDVGDLIRRKEEEKKGEINKFYDAAIKTEEVKERQGRIDAIAVFERFIQLYPDDMKYSPDAMTRLAELYYEKTVDDQQQAMTAFEDRAKLGSDEAPPDEMRSFEKSIALYQQIITKFPKYHLIDSIYYLLGWCLGEQGEQDEARDTFHLLTEKFPTSHYVPEAWVRIGEYYFDFQSQIPGEVNQKIQEGIAAYQHAISFKDSPFYDKALYKLGWSYYRINDYDHAVDAFIKLIDYYDDMKRAGKDTGGDLRQEALQYTAVSFADDNWSKTHTLAGYFGTIGARSYEYELFKKLGDIQFDETHYDQAIEAYREVIRQNPDAPDAPQTQDRIVASYGRMNKREEAFTERRVLAKAYSDCTPWAHANRSDPDALQAARELIEKTLLLTAHYYHEQADELAKSAADETLDAATRDQKRALALQAYRNAADGYNGYLKQFPRSKDAYDIQYLLAETLYYSLQFKLASEAFAAVRDSTADAKYLVNAAYYVVLSLQREVEQEEQQNLIERREPCTVEKCKDLKDLNPQAIPDIRLKLVAAADLYMQKAPSAEDAPLLSYTAGQTYFRYLHWDEARDRYDDVIKRFPDKDVAVYAYEDELISAMLHKDWKETERIATLMLDLKPIQADPKKYEEKRLVKYGARFEQANGLMSQRDWEGAAKLYMSVVTDTEKEVKEHGAWANADKALFDAATCYKAEYKFDSAMRTYEKLFTDYPKSDLAEQSLFFVAENAEKAFEFDKAVARYKQLVQQFPKSDDAKAAQFNAARRLEALQRYKEASDEYLKYAITFPTQTDAPDMTYQAAIMFQRMHDTLGLVNGLQRFIARYQGVKEQNERIVQAELKIANAYVELNKVSDARAAYKKTVEYYDRFKMTPDQYTAAQSASEAAYNIAEDDLADFDKIKFDPHGKGKKLVDDMKSQLEHLAKRLEDIKGQYSSIIVKYRWPEWMTAALYRMGYADEQFSGKIMASPCPHEIKVLGEDACEQFIAALSEKMTPLIEKAANEYQTAADKARDLRVVNKWTKLAMEKVCQNTPANCRSMRDPREEMISESLSPLPLTADVNGSRSVMYDPPPPPAPKPVPAPAPATAPGIGAPPVSPTAAPGAPAVQPATAPVPAAAAPAATTAPASTTAPSTTEAAPPAMMVPLPGAAPATTTPAATAPVAAPAAAPAGGAP